VIGVADYKQALRAKTGQKATFDINSCCACKSFQFKI
jgi:hypothetical protein